MVSRKLFPSQMKLFVITVSFIISFMLFFYIYVVITVIYISVGEIVAFSPTCFDSDCELSI